MDVIKTSISELLLLKPRIFDDARGYFFESYNKAEFEKYGLFYDFIQDNESKSEKGVIRGLHFQLPPYAQAKLVRVVEGKIWDVVVDLRKHSPTFGQFYGAELSAENKLQFLIPRGFAHGFSVLSSFAVVQYKCDNTYNKSSERGLKFNSITLGIDWKVNLENAIISEKDVILPQFDISENYYD